MPETSPLVGSDVGSDLPDGGDQPAAADQQPTSTSEQTSEFYDAVAQVVKVIRPAIQADQGDIFLRDVDDETGVVSVELVGACVDCPASTQTLKQGLERILKQRVDGVTEVRHVGAVLAGFDDLGEGTRVSL